MTNTCINPSTSWPYRSRHLCTYPGIYRYAARTVTVGRTVRRFPVFRTGAVHLHEAAGIGPMHSAPGDPASLPACPASLDAPVHLDCLHRLQQRLMTPAGPEGMAQKSRLIQADRLSPPPPFSQQLGSQQRSYRTYPVMYVGTYVSVVRIRTYLLLVCLYCVY